MSVLGFYKEKTGPEEIVALVKGEPPQLYVEIPSGIRNRVEIVVGNKIRCIVKGIVDKEGNIISKIDKESLWEVIGYWHELHIPPEDVSNYGLKKNHHLGIILKSVVRASEEIEI